MKFKTLYELAKQSLRSKKKNTRRTIFGLSFGLVIILPLVMVMLGVNLGINNKYAQSSNRMNVTIEMMDYRQQLEDIESIYEGGGSTIPGILAGSKHIQEFVDYNKNVNSFVYEQYKHFVSKKNIFYIDGTIVDHVNTNDIKEYYFNVIDMDMSDSFFPLESLKNNASIYVEGYDADFQNDTKRQVVVTQRFLDNNNYKAENFYGKNLSINATGEVDNYFCKGYKVVGILSNEFLTSHENSDQFYKADFYFLSYDMYNEKGERIIPADADISVAQNNPYSLNINNVFGEYIGSIPNTYVRFESENAKSLIDFYEYYDEHYQSYRYNISNSDGFGSFYSYYDTFRNIICVFLSIAITVVIIILLNLFITVYHNVDYKSQYLAMLESMGMKGKDLIKTFLTENFIIATKSNIIITVLSLVIGIIIKIFCDTSLKRVISLGFTLVPVWSILVAIILGIAFVYATTLLIAYGCAKGFTKKNITEVLNSQNLN